MTGIVIVIFQLSKINTTFSELKKKEANNKKKSSIGKITFIHLTKCWHFFSVLMYNITDRAFSIP